MGEYRYKDSGVEWLGRVPDHWKVDRIKDHMSDDLSLINEKALSLVEEVSHFSIPAFDVDASPDQCSGDSISSGKKVLFGKGLLYSKLNCWKPRVWLYDISEQTSLSVASTEFIGLRPTASAVLSLKFMRYLLSSSAFTGSVKIYLSSVTNSHQRIAPSTFVSQQIPLPPINEQKFIAEHLDLLCAKIDSVIEIKQEQLRKNQLIQASIIQHAVTKGLQQNQSMQQTSSSWIGEIPKHWKVSKLKRILAETDYGISESTKPEGKHAVLKMGNIVDGEIAYTKIEYVESVSNQLILKQDDLLFNRTNSHDQVAKVGIFRGGENDQVTFASYLVRLRPNHTSSPHYLNYFLNTEAFLGIARKMAIPSVQQANLNPNRYGRLEVVVPPLTEQIEIAEYLDKKTADLQKVNDVLNKQIHVLAQYRKSLIHECVTGKKQVASYEA